MFKKMQTDWMLLMANLYIQQDKFSRALCLLEAAELKAPERADIKKALALTLLELGEARRCLAVLKSLSGQVFTEGEKASLLLLKSRALWLDGDHDGAQRAMKRRCAVMLGIR
ncbi:hypothetical protein SG34_032565 [Thalassomonas viridans]|uniref:Type III secretion protein n=1 Tax=Thalassomonas viridans TaxID=137584 RepID=A0AAF0CAK5_9GAMM|nr:hypothetical protein [Thalassomonas viridans]WDE08652.1 hypothetical protein SG34_032565 [Thalassomonas viridans]